MSQKLTPLLKKKKLFFEADTEVPDQFALLRRQILAFAVHIYSEKGLPQ